MTPYSEVTAANLKCIRGARGMNQEQLGAILGLSGYHISNIENGRRLLSTAEKSLLDLYFFGTIPFEIVNEKLLGKVLDFTPRQWDVIRILANKEGKQTPGQWIAGKIRDYLAFTQADRFAESREPVVFTGATPEPTLGNGTQGP